MRTSVLCPVYRKWLQLNPEQAREQRQTFNAQALQMRRNGHIKQAVKRYRLVWEVAQSVLLSLRQPDNTSNRYQQDLVVFAAAAMAHQQCCNQVSDTVNDSIMADTQQQLSALSPLYASEPDLLNTIAQLKEWLRCNNLRQSSSLIH